MRDRKPSGRIHAVAGWRVGLTLASCFLAAGAFGEAAQAPPVGLDALLKLPSGTRVRSAAPLAGGATRNEWLARFEEARLELLGAEKGLATAQHKLGEMAAGTSAWQVAAPGGVAGASENGPLSFSLRQEIRRHREDIVNAKLTLDELRVEANLAGVPPEWTGDQPVLDSRVRDDR
ncbi:MAG: hypothetical protein O7B23_05565 [Deltaproteobacteria bacterium]|nr:hypothetical protein [Deltaproteobacteria bacterium]